MDLPQHETARKQIETLRRKLLDDSNRNPLVSFRYSDRARGHVRIIDEVPDLLLKRFEEGDKLTLIALPEPPDEPADEESDAFLMALEAARAADAEYLEAIRTLGEEDIESPAFAKHERALKDRVRDQLGLGPQPDFRAMSPAAWARECGLDPRYDLPTSDHVEGVPEKHHDNRIQTLLVPEVMERWSCLRQTGQAAGWCALMNWRGERIPRARCGCISL